MKQISQGAKTNTFKVFAIFFGTIIGAGFASGREVYIYFARFGGWGIIATFLAGILFFLLGYMFLKLGRKIKVDTLYQFLYATFGRFTKIIEIIIALSYMIVISAMLAGFDSIQKILFPNSILPILQIISTILCVIATIGGIKNITKINFLILPAILIFFVIIFISSIINKEQSIAFIVFDNSIMALISPLISAIIFVCSNMFLTGFILLKAGDKSDDYIDKKASLLTGLSIFLIIFFSCFCIAINPSCLNFDMPFLLLSFKVGDIFIYYSVIVLWCAIFTSAVASLYTLSWWLNSYIHNLKFSTILCASVGFIISKIGFSAIIDLLYPLTGIMDIVFIISSIVLFYKSTRKNK